MQWVLLVVGLAAGGAFGWLLARLRMGEHLSRVRAELASERDKQAWAAKAESELRETFSALARDALSANADDFLKRAREQLDALLSQVRGDWGTQREALKGLVHPLETALGTLDRELHQIEEKREGAYKGLDEHLRQLGTAQSRLRDTTLKLEGAMRSTTARGLWGELQLRRVVELAGMIAHVDFTEQVSTESGRPDMIVKLPNGGELPVDAKAPAAAYLDAVELEGEARKARLADHAGAMKQRILELSRRQYWAQFARSPELVVMFVPFESAVSAAFEADGDLLEFGVRHRVLVASPITLLALLRTAAFGWQQHQIAESAREIALRGKELYDRVVNVLKPISRIGEQLDKAVEQYNKGIGSLESRLLPAVRRFGELAAPSEGVPDLQAVDRRSRQLSHGEMSYPQDPAEAEKL